MSGFIGDLLEAIADFFIDVWMLRRHRAVKGRPSNRWDDDAAAVVVFNGWGIAVSVVVLVASVVLFFVLKLPVWISLLPIAAGAVYVGYEVKAGYAVDPHRVYVTGISAGGAMTSIMLACYSDVFAAGAIHSGGMYKGATTISGSAYALLGGSIYSADSNGRLAWQCSGSPKPRPLPVLVFHGSADSTVNRINGQQAVRQFLQTNDLADDGVDNDSVKYVPTSTYHGQVPGGRAYTVDAYAYNGRILAQHYVVQGMGHAWSGSQSGLPFTDPQGPDATLITWLFRRGNQR